jgi:predicted hotdog family 3-hydroxylacyl-ACP dehydratase
MPRVSVIIPTYNRAHLLVEAIGSVLNQTLDNLELIVVDDGSTDNTECVVASVGDPRLKYVRRLNGGVAAARNTGLKNASGEFVAFLDSDDLFLPDKLAEQIGAMDDDPSPGLVYGLYYRLKQDGSSVRQGNCYPAGSRYLPLRTPRIFIQTVLVKRSWLERIGGFDENLSVCEDQDLLWRLSAAGCWTVCIPKALTIVREQPASLTKSCYLYMADMSAYLDKIFNDPRMRAEVLAARDQVYAHQYITAAASAYQSGEPALGRDIMAQIITMSSGFTKQETESLAIRFVNFMAGRSVDELKDILGIVQQSLPERRLFTRTFGNRMWYEFSMRAAFEAFGRGERTEAGTYAIKAILHRPPGLRNRGLLSILLRSLIGNQFFDLMRPKRR